MGVCVKGRRTKGGQEEGEKREKIKEGRRKEVREGRRRLTIAVFIHSFIRSLIQQPGSLWHRAWCSR